MANPSTVDAAGRAIAGLLTYNPGPGIYSRLERAVEAMPENVRVQELPGLIKRYKDGVPGWELRETDLEGLIGDAQVIPRQDLLDRVRERSPVYTHKEKMLGGNDQSRSRLTYAPIGESTPSARTIFGDYGQGGDDYREVLLLQPGAVGKNYQSHWNEVFGANNAVAHARFDTHGDALRINELQSDLGIHNRKAREAAAGFIAGGGSPDYAPRNDLPFPLEDAWADLLIKRLALEAARQGHRAIEVASPASVFAKTGNRGDAAASLARMEHFYGKVVPGAVERLGQRMGGLAEEQVEQLGPRLRYELPFNGGELVAEPRGAADRIFRREFPQSGPMPAFDVDPGMAYNKLEWAYSHKPESVGEYATLLQFALANRLKSGGMEIEEATRVAGQRMPEIVRLAEEQARRADAYDRVQELRDAQAAQPGWSPSRLEAGRRYIMSDEMRKRILTEGIPAAVAIGIGTDAVLDRLDREAPKPQMR